MNKETLKQLESILEDDAILSTMTAEQQAALEAVFGDYHFQEAWKEDYQKFLETSISDAKKILKSIKPKKQKAAKKPRSQNNIKLNVFYDTPKGVVKTFSFSPAGIYYYNSAGATEVTNNFGDWVERPDLVEFPHTWNPKLPYEFDLYWDLKTCNDLRNFLLDVYYDTRFEENPQPLPFSQVLGYADDLRDIIKDTKIYNQPLEQIMTKFEAAQKLHLKVFDYALPPTVGRRARSQTRRKSSPLFCMGIRQK